MPTLSNPRTASELLRRHPAVRLLRKDQAGLVVAFLYSAFRKQRKNSYGKHEITSLLTDFLFAANEEETIYPRTPVAYLESWTEDGFLRQFYGDGADEATFELTPAGEQALQWVSELESREFVGAESRLLQVFEQLRTLAEGTTIDLEERRNQLLARRAKIDEQLAALERGEIDRMDTTAIRERFQLAEINAQQLLADFRQIEDNFRRLNAQAREELVGYEAARGELLEEIFNSRSAILDTDQGKTFTAFWLFLMNQRERDKLKAHLSQIASLPELDDAIQSSSLFSLEQDLVDAGIRVNQMTDRLIEQLRRFLQSKAYLEGRRLTQLLTDFEKLALAVKSDPPNKRAFASISGRPSLQLIMDRGPYAPPEQLRLSDFLPEAGQTDTVNTDLLYTQLYVDPLELKGRLDVLLRERDQISLLEVTQQMPVERGLTELVTYFNIATQWEGQNRATIDPERRQRILYQQDEVWRAVDFPETVFLA
ncbi:MAG: DUF3375 domain-containing protein [Bacteroidota bacterium]